MVQFLQKLSNVNLGEREKMAPKLSKLMRNARIVKVAYYPIKDSYGCNIAILGTGIQGQRRERERETEKDVNRDIHVP